MPYSTMYANSAQRRREARASLPANALPDGFYTIEFADGSHTTLKLSAWANKPGSQVVSYLFGSDNTRDYKGYGHVTGRTFVQWRNGASTERLRTAISVLLMSDSTDTFTTAFALKSGCCARCGRTLTVPASIHRGLGPECFGQLNS